MQWQCHCVPVSNNDYTNSPLKLGSLQAKLFQCSRQPCTLWGATDVPMPSEITSTLMRGTPSSGAPPLPQRSGGGAASRRPRCKPMGGSCRTAVLEYPVRGWKALIRSSVQCNGRPNDQALRMLWIRAARCTSSRHLGLWYYSKP